jgi:hypothetical protein
LDEKKSLIKDENKIKDEIERNPKDILLLYELKKGNKKRKKLENVLNSIWENNLILTLDVDSNIFLYGKLDKITNRPTLFVWNLGDGREVVGQNIRIKYDKTGMYHVKLNIDDGLTESDYFVTINVINEGNLYSE